MKTRKTAKKPKKEPSAPQRSQKSRNESISSRPGEVPEDWVPIKAPANLEEMIMNWINYPVVTVGWCFLCNRPIFSELDMIPGTSSHNCEAGRRLDEEIRATEEAQRLKHLPIRPSRPRKPRKRSK